MAAKRLRAPSRSQLTPSPDHAAAPQPFWESAEFRTAVQGVALDVTLAVCLLIVQATSSDTVDWKWLLYSLGKTVLMTAAAAVMKRVKPRQATDPSAS